MPDARDRYLRPGNPERDNYHPDVVPNSDEMNATGGPLNSARFRARQADAWAQNDPAKAAFHYEAVGRIKKAEAPKSTMDSLKNTLGRLSMTSAREQEKNVGGRSRDARKAHEHNRTPSPTNRNPSQK